jgi:hypothetical protein
VGGPHDEILLFLRGWHWGPYTDPDQQGDTLDHTTTDLPLILFVLYDSHEQENDVTKQIVGIQIGAISKSFQ